MKTLLIVVAFGAAVASPAFAQSGNGHQHHRFTWSEMNVHQQWAPRNLNNFEDRNYEGYPRSAN
jgi:hypothetical protein